MNYIIKFRIPERYRAAGVDGYISTVMFRDQPEEDTGLEINNVDDVILAMEKLYPNVKDYEIIETLLSIEDLEDGKTYTE